MVGTYRILPRAPTRHESASIPLLSVKTLSYKFAQVQT